MERDGIRGVWPALITPLAEGDKLDAPASRRLVRRLVDAGVHGILVLGSSGEGASLRPRVRREMVDIVADELKGDVPIIVGSAQCNLDAVIEDAEMARAIGATALLAAPPFYGSITRNALEDFYMRLGTSAGVPIVVYNIPAFTHQTIPPDIVGRLAERGAIRGIKDSSRDFDYFQQVLAAVSGNPDFWAFTGTDSLLMPALLAGGRGGLTIGANLVPRLCVEIYEAVVQGRLGQARDLQQRLTRISVALRSGDFPAAAKTVLSLLGLCEDRPASPKQRLTAAERDLLEAEMVSLGVLQPAGGAL
jgi:4-hydroxy-tetrahydrodipicolinate synthase